MWSWSSRETRTGQQQLANKQQSSEHPLISQYPLALSGNTAPQTPTRPLGTCSLDSNDQGDYYLALPTLFQALSLVITLGLMINNGSRQRSAVCSSTCAASHFLQSPMLIPAHNMHRTSLRPHSHLWQQTTVSRFTTADYFMIAFYGISSVRSFWVDG